MGQKLFYGYKSKFPVRVSRDSHDIGHYVCTVSDGLATARPVFDHLDWDRSNLLFTLMVIELPASLTGSIAFIPDPKDYFLRGVSEERQRKEE